VGVDCTVDVDDVDQNILRVLQRNARITNQELALRVGLTPAPCLRRVRRLEKSGVIRGYTAVIDLDVLRKRLEVVVQVRVLAQSDQLHEFEARVSALEDVVEMRRLFGGGDYLMLVRATNLDTFDEWLRVHLRSTPAVVSAEPALSAHVVKSALQAALSDDRPPNNDVGD
jgi:DNA-binding Lrp family transcriptional regulator